MDPVELQALAAAAASAVFALAAAIAMLRGERADPKWLFYSELLRSWPPQGFPFGPAPIEPDESGRR